MTAITKQQAVEAAQKIFNHTGSTFSDYKEYQRACEIRELILQVEEYVVGTEAEREADVVVLTGSDAAFHRLYELHWKQEWSDRNWDVAGEQRKSCASRAVLEYFKVNPMIAPRRSTVTEACTGWNAHLTSKDVKLAIGRLLSHGFLRARKSYGESLVEVNY
jgi:hypothetical protein